MSGWIQNSKWIQNAFENEIKNDFEVKEKKEKENWKIKEFKRVVKFIFGSLPKLPIFIWVEKYIWNSIWICIWFIIKIGFEDKIENDLGNGKFSFVSIWPEGPLTLSLPILARSLLPLSAAQLSPPSSPLPFPLPRGPANSAAHSPSLPAGRPNPVAQQTPHAPCCPLSLSG